jgi:CheY-like chemotaxis protein
MENFPKDHPGRGNLEEILTAGLRARDVVRQLLNYSRKSVAHKQTVDMAALIEANKNLIRSSIPTTIDIHYHMEPSLPPVNADKTQMHQELLNLTTNAAAAMESAGGQMDIELSRVRIADADHNNVYGLKPGKYLSLAVRDTGCGIPPDIIDRIFDPYFTTREAGKGSGMGLAVVHGIVEYHGGGIHVESAPEKGTEVRLLLPEANDKTVRPDAGGTTTSGGSGRILFVDDEPSIAEVNRQLLERHGYQVQAFTDPETAVREFSRHPDDFDLVVSDMTMPKMTGDRLAAEIRKLRPEMPVILCTGFSERMDERKAKTMGISEFLIKPVGIEKLVQTIRKMMSDE